MSDKPDDEELVGWGDACAIGERIVDMCERVKTMHKVAPGTEARWVLGVNTDDFEIIVRVKERKVT